MCEWSVGQWIVVVISFQKIFGLCGLKGHHFRAIWGHFRAISGHFRAIRGHFRVIQGHFRGPQKHCWGVIKDDCCTDGRPEIGNPKV